MPATSTPPGCEPDAEPAPTALASWAPKPPDCTSASTTSLRRYGWPSAPRVVCALARFSAVTSIRSRSAVRPVAETLSASNMPISATHAHRGLEDPDPGVRHLDGRLVLERVGGELGRLGVDVDRGAVGAGRAGGVDLRGELHGVQRVLGVLGAERRGERAVEVDVHALVAR